MTVVDEHFAAARRGDLAAFASWMGRVERPIRASLGPFVRAADVEGVVQETLMRMWTLANDPNGRQLSGENASLRFAIGIARNLARNEARRHRREQYLPPEDLPDVPVDPAPTPDPKLRRAIAECIDALARRPVEALRARLYLGAMSGDRAAAESVGMTLNTFLQNVVRARQQLARCLKGKKVSLAELVS